MTIQDWLGENNTLGIDIWEKKYRRDDESFDQWLTRVSGSNECVRKLIIEKKFLFGGRILSNRGISENVERVTYSNCFLAGTKVLTRTGYKNIEDIRVGEYVLTGNNSWERVNETMSREYNGTILELQSRDLYHSIFCTPNHQFLTGTGWKKAEDLIYKSDSHTLIDRLVTPDLKLSNCTDNLNNENKIIDFLEGFELKNDQYEIKEFPDHRIGVGHWCTSPIGKKYFISPKQNALINRYAIFDEDFAYFMGRWLGDGSITTGKGKNNPSIFQIVFNATTERDAFERCKQIGEKILGKQSNWRETSQNILTLRFENEIFSTWVLNNFGEKCDTKHVPDWVGFNKNVLLGLFDADGCVTSQGSCKIVLKNTVLLNWARDALYYFGINASLIKQEVKQDASRFVIHTGQSIKLLPYLTKTYKDNRLDAKNRNGLIKIDNIITHFIPSSFLVYNLSVENYHSYVVEGVVAHNCYVISPPEDSIESIYETCKKLARTYSYGGGCGIDISKLAPAGARVHNQAKTTSGAVSFMDTFSQVTEQIGQNGRRKIA